MLPRSVLQVQVWSVAWPLIHLQGKRKLQIPAGVRPFVIGKKGAKIQEIQTKTATKLTLQTQADDQELADDDLIDIDIEGDAEGVQLAIDLIQKIVSERVRIPVGVVDRRSLMIGI